MITDQQAVIHYIYILHKTAIYIKLPIEPMFLWPWKKQRKFWEESGEEGWGHLHCEVTDTCLWNLKCGGLSVADLTQKGVFQWQMLKSGVFQWKSRVVGWCVKKMGPLKQKGIFRWKWSFRVTCMKKMGPFGDRGEKDEVFWWEHPMGQKVGVLNV